MGHAFALWLDSPIAEPLFDRYAAPPRSFLAPRGRRRIFAARSERRAPRPGLFVFRNFGAGKTTISRLAPPDANLLTDEISYLRPAARGYRAYGTPFAGELARPGENLSAPLAALYFLEKGPL